MQLQRRTWLREAEIKREGGEEKKKEMKVQQQN